MRMDLNTKIADLQTQIVAARQQMLEMQDENERVIRENKELKEAAARTQAAKPKVVYGCYKFEGKEGPYCPGCYDANGKKHLTSLVNIHFRRCNVCHTEIGAG
jgi:regulator of replication initiation timing